VSVRAPFKEADLRDLERVVAVVERIQARHRDEWDDDEFDSIHLVRSAALEAIRDVEVGESDVHKGSHDDEWILQDEEYQAQKEREAEEEDAEHHPGCDGERPCSCERGVVEL
jgi:hypothetical protein